MYKVARWLTEIKSVHCFNICVIFILYFNSQATKVGLALIQELNIDTKPKTVGLFSSIAAQCQNAAAKIKEEPNKSSAVPPEEQDPYIADNVPQNHTKENPPKQNLTRLSVYMSNLPLLQREKELDRETTQDTNSNQTVPSDEKSQKKKLSLKEYKRRLKGGENQVESQTNSQNRVERSQIGSQSEMGRQFDSQTDSQSSVDSQMDSPSKIDSQMDSLSSVESQMDDQSKVDGQINSLSRVDGHIDGPLRISKYSDRKSRKDRLRGGNQVYMQTQDNDDTLPELTTNNENPDQICPKIVTSQISLENKGTNVQDQNDHSPENTAPSVKIEVVDDTKINISEPVVVNTPPLATVVAIKEEKSDVGYDSAMPVLENSVRKESNDGQTTGIKIIVSDSKEITVKKENDSSVVHTNQDTTMESDDLDEELPNLCSESDSEADARYSSSSNNPGDSVSFKTTEIISFKPYIYAKVLDDLDKLKLYLGDTAKLSTTTHREKCMQLLDTIGDRMIANRSRKKTLVRSIGNNTETEDKKPKILITSEVQTDSVTTQENSGKNVVEPECDKSKMSTNESISGKEFEEDNQSETGNDTASVHSQVNALKKNISTEKKTDDEAKTQTGETNDANKDTEGYFTMLLKLNGAFDDQLAKTRSKSKTVKTTVSTTSLRLAAYNVAQNDNGLRPPEGGSTPDYDRSGQCTPETAGATTYGANNIIQYVDGRLCLPPVNAQDLQNNIGAGDGTGPTRIVGHTNQNATLQWNSGQAPGSQQYYSHTVIQGAASQQGYSNSNQRLNDKVTNTNRNEMNGPVGHQTQSFVTLPVPAFNGQNTSSTYPADNNTAQNDYQDVDLRNGGNVANFQQPQQPQQQPESNFNNQVYPYNGQMYNQAVEPAAYSGSYSSVSTSAAVYPTEGTVDTFYATTTTNSSVEFVQDEEVIDKEMETEMVDILEILHEGTPAEQASLKKPKGRSKRARKKRRAIAEAEKLFSLVTLAQKIESQHKLSVLSEKQKKREFYKKIIQTYASKGPENRAPKDEETMIMECVEQLMGETIGKDDQANPEKSIAEATKGKRKSTEDVDFALDDYQGFNDKKKKHLNDDDDCQIVRHIKKARLEAERKQKKGPPPRKAPFQPPVRKNGFNHQVRRSTSSERFPWSRGTPDRMGKRSPEKMTKQKDFNKPWPPRMHNRLDFGNNIKREMNAEEKKNMFELWSDSRYINHLFITANKITYGTQSSKPWRNKVKICVRSISDRKADIAKEMERNRLELEKKDLSFSRREQVTQEKNMCSEHLTRLNLLGALFKFYLNKFVILDILQKIPDENKTDPKEYTAIGSSLIIKLESEMDNLKQCKRELGLYRAEVNSESDRKLVIRSYDEVVEIIENIKNETKKYHEKKSKFPNAT